LFYSSYLFEIAIISYYNILQRTKGGCMAKRLFLVLPVLFVFSLLFVHVSEAFEGIQNGPTEGTYSLTIDQIGFYSTTPTGSPTPAPDVIVSLPNSIIIHEQIGGATNPNISDFVYAGEIPNGNWVAIGLHVTGIDPLIVGPTFPFWGAISFDSRTSPTTITINDASRKRITCIFQAQPIATVTDL
jgi:hypothetical protein